MSYDPAWDMPLVNWRQQGSYEGGSVPPTVEPDAGTQVYLGPVAREWLPWICGSLDQLRNPSAWEVIDDDAMYDTLRRVDTLLGLICGNGGSSGGVLTRLQDCVLQTSSDGGATWTDVPGWTDNFADCVRDALPPPPPPIGPGPLQQYACNLAGYLATEIIQKAITIGVADYNLGKTQLQYAADVSQAILAEAFPYANFFIQAVNVLYGEITAGTIADFTAASTDATLWSDVTCAIFNAIRNDGAVTDANYPSIVTNICALGYSRAAVQTALCDFITHLGAANTRALQIFGALDTVDCSNCGSWCRRFDFTVDDGGFTAISGHGTYVAGVGWQSTPSGSGQYLWLDAILPHIEVFGRVDVCVTLPDASGGAARQCQGYLAGSSVVVTAMDTAATTACERLPADLTGTIDEVFLKLESNPAPGGVITVCSIAFSANGVNPYGTDNCGSVGCNPP